jgi:hypothetical protein
VKCKGEFHCAEVGPEVTASFGNCSHDEVANFTRKFLELGVAQTPQIARLANISKRHGNLER